MPSSKSAGPRARRAGRGGRHRHHGSEEAAVTRPRHPGKHLPLRGGGRRNAAGGGEQPKPQTITPPRTSGPTLPLKGRVRKAGAGSYEDAGDAKQQTPDEGQDGTAGAVFAASKTQSPNLLFNKNLHSYRYPK